MTTNVNTMRLRIILPVAYLAAVLFLLLINLGGGGRGGDGGATYFLSIPAIYLVVFLASTIPLIGLPIFAIPLIFLLGAAQYFYVGRILDKLLDYWRKKSGSQQN
jgi:hypothetical protein